MHWTCCHRNSYYREALSIALECAASNVISAGITKGACRLLPVEMTGNFKVMTFTLHCIFEQSRETIRMILYTSIQGCCTPH